MYKLSFYFSDRDSTCSAERERETERESSKVEVSKVKE